MNRIKSSSAVYLIPVFLLLHSCEPHVEKGFTDPENWKKRMVEHTTDTTLESGSTFLSIYNQIFIRDENDHYNLTATVSMHNPNAKDSLYIDRAVFYDTGGKAIRTYFYHSIYIRPMETVQIVIPVLDNEGGTGANFIFDWRKKRKLVEPLFEAVMVSSQGNHGISFVTEGRRLR